MLARRLATLLPTWRATVWERRIGGTWIALPARAARSSVAISAMNPQARPLSSGANRARDAALRRHLHACGLPLRRCRGRLGSFHEEGWLVPPAAAPRLLAAWGQIAGVAWHPAGCWLAWRWGGRRRLRA